MWVFVMFDLPTTTKEHKREYRRFHDALEAWGFFRVQYSLYARHCGTDDRAQTMVDRVRRELPAEGEVRITLLTDKQWERIIVLGHPHRDVPEEPPEQLSFW